MKNHLKCPVMVYRLLLVILYITAFSFKIAAKDINTAFFVSVTGNDQSIGSYQKPFLTLERARMAIRKSAIKKVYIRTGIYKRLKSFILTDEDSGSSWCAYPEDDPNTAIINGAGINDVLLILGGSNITIEGLTVQNYSSRGIGVHGGKGWKNAAPHFDETVGAARSNIIRNNIVESGHIDAPGWDRAGINTQGATPNTHILNNVVRNTTGYGIGVWSLQETDDISGSIVKNNVVLNSCMEAKDGAAIYICDRTASSKGILIEENFIRDYGIYENELRGIYLDDWASNVIIRANIITGKGTQPILIHGGSNNIVSGNIIDLGNSGKPCILNYASHKDKPMLNNQFVGNVILSNYVKDISGGAFRKFGNVTNPIIKNNLYFNYAGGIVNTGGQFYILKDAFPITADPSISGWDYDIADGSSIYQMPVAFKPLKRSWGPKGYKIPKEGTESSCLKRAPLGTYIHAESFDIAQGISKNGIAGMGIDDAKSLDDLDNIHLGNGFDQFPAMAISSCDDGDWLCFQDVNLKKTFNHFVARCAVIPANAGGAVEVRLNELTGKLLARLPLESTGSYHNYIEQRVLMRQSMEGNQKLYIIFKGGRALGNFDYFKFE